MALISTDIRSFDKTVGNERPRAAIFSDNEWGSEVKGISLMSVKIHYSSEVIAAPVETGTKSFDNKVINPIKVTVVGKIVVGSDGWESAVRDIEKMMANRDYEFYSVCDGCDYANNLILKECPIEKNPKEFDFINIELQFVEALLIEVDENDKPENEENTDTRDNGGQIGEISFPEAAGNPTWVVEAR